MADDDPVLVTRLSMLRPVVDVDAGKANVLRESLRRRRRGRIVAVAAAIVAFVLIGGAVANAARGQNRDGANLVVGGGVATSTPPPSETPVARAPGTSVPVGTSVVEETSTTSITTTTGPVAPSSLLPPTTGATAPTTTQAPQADVVLTIRPESTSVRPGDRAFVEVVVTNRGRAPALYESPFCGTGPAPVTVSKVPVPPAMMDYVGRPMNVSGADWDAVVAGNALSGTQLVEADQLDQPAGTYCATIGSPPLSLAAGETVRTRVGWDVRLPPGDLPTPHTLFYFANFGMPEPGQATTAVHASVPFTVEADPLMDGTGPPAWAAALNEPAVQQWLAKVQPLPMLVAVWFGRGEWVFELTALNGPSNLIVRVDPATSEVRSATEQGELPRI